MRDTMNNQILRALKVHGPMTSSQLINTLKPTYTTTLYRALSSLIKLGQLDKRNDLYEIIDATYAVPEDVDMFPIDFEKYSNEPLIRYFAKASVSPVETQKLVAQEFGLDPQKVEKQLLEVLLIYCVMKQIPYFHARRVLNYHVPASTLEPYLEEFTQKYCKTEHMFDDAD